MSNSIQQTIAKIVEKEKKEATGKKSTTVKVAASSLPIIQISGLTQ